MDVRCHADHIRVSCISRGLQQFPNRKHRNLKTSPFKNPVLKQEESVAYLKHVEISTETLHKKSKLMTTEGSYINANEITILKKTTSTNFKLFQIFHVFSKIPKKALIQSGWIRFWMPLFTRNWTFTPDWDVTNDFEPEKYTLSHDSLNQGKLPHWNAN